MFALFLSFEIPNYIHNQNNVSDLPIQTQREKQKCTRWCRCWCTPAERLWSRKIQKAEVGTSLSVLCGQEGGSPLGKAAVAVVRRGRTLLGACFHSDHSGEEQSRKVHEVHSYGTVLAPRTSGHIYSEVFRQYIYQ